MKKSLVGCFFLGFVIAATFAADKSITADKILKELKDLVDDYKKEKDAKNDDIAVEDIAKEDHSLDDEIELDAEIQRIENDKPTCKDLDTHGNCFNVLKANGCKDKAVRDRCPRTCLACCADKEYYDHFCKSRAKFCHASFAKFTMRAYCPKTCEYCGKAPAPPPCLDSKYGCCWDRKTPASGPFGSGKENCPPCVDKKDVHVCNTFKTDCFNFNPAIVKGKQIRAFCPKTCRVCGEHPYCMDDPRQESYCPQYKSEGLCKTSAKYMRFWCAKTCGFCKPCKDTYNNCELLKKHRACKQQTGRMKVLCPLTCGLCPKCEYC